jgi:hypothetical protein
VTQLAEEKMDLLMKEQDYQPLAFFPGYFKGSQKRLKIPDKECFAIFDIVTNVDYLLVSDDEFPILPDHLYLTYLTYIYNPLSVDPTPDRHAIHKLQR